MSKQASSFAAQGCVRAIIHGLVLLQVLQPWLTVAHAAELAPTTPGVTLDAAANGVPVVNIATPNAAGLSHNSYQQFNVGSEGLILNNSAQPVNTQLGGYITGNANLGAGGARLILNEVTAAHPSQLNGYLEVAGQRAGVIVANPHGITCDGCGFINTSQATLATGAPQWNADGSLQGFLVEQGTLRFDGAGLNAGNVDGLALYARVLELNANLHATTLDVVTGANRIDAGTGAATPLAAASAAPAYAIDSSALGGMFADTIRLVGTEAGVGMRLAAPVAALTGQLEILANGDVRLARSSAVTDLRVESTGALALTDRMSAGGNIRLDAVAALQAPVAVDAIGDLDVTAGGLLLGGGSLRAGGDLTLTLPSFDRAASGGSYSAGGRLSVLATGDIVFSGAEVSTPGALTLASNAGAIRLDSRVLSGADTALRAGDIRVGADGFLASMGTLDVSAGRLDNLGLLYGRNALSLQVANALNNGSADQAAPAYLLSDGEIRIRNQAGGALAELNNLGSSIESRSGAIDIDATLLRNINVGWSLTRNELDPVYTYSPSYYDWASYYGVSFTSTSGLHAYRREYLTTDYVAEPGRRGNIIAAGDITIAAGTVENDRSTISSGNNLKITADHVYNTGTAATDLTRVNVSDRWHTCNKHSDGNTTCNAYEAFFREPDQSKDTALILALIEGRNKAEVIGATVNCAPDQAGLPGTSCPSESTGSLANTLAGEWSSVPWGVAGLVPPGGLFHLNTDPLHPYLIETDPALNTYAGFLGSAYLLAHLEGWAPGLTQRRLGDAYYELAIIREFLLASLGSRFIDPAISDEKAQFEYLMQNAIAAADSLHLSPGIALSREQIDALQADIVWLEERSVAGQQVLVPVVYLAQGSSRLLRHGAVIGGGSVSIEGETFANGGLVQARDGLAITTQQDLLNQGGSLVAGGDLSLASRQADIENVSGHISGANVTLVAAGDIVHRTAVEEHTVQVGSAVSTYTNVGDTASVRASGNLVQAAGHDLRLEAATVSGNNVILAAGNDIVLDTVQVRQARSFSGADWEMAEEQLAHLQTQVEAVQQLSLTAGADIAAIGAYLKAGGDIDLQADNIRVAAVLDKESRSDHTAIDEDYTHTESLDETLRGGVLAAGGNLTLRARDGDVHLTGATLSSAGGTVTLAAANDLILDTLSETHYSYFESHTEQSGGLTTTLTDVRKLDLDVLARGTVVQGLNLDLSAGNDASFTSAQLAAADTLAVVAGGDISVRAALDLHDHQESVTRQKSFTGVGELLMKSLEVLQDLNKFMLITSRPMEILSNTWIAEKLELPTPEDLLDASTLSTSLVLSGSRSVTSVQSESLAASTFHAGKTLALTAGAPSTAVAADNSAASGASVDATPTAADAPRLGNISITGSQLTAGALQAPSDSEAPPPGTIQLTASGDIAIGTQQVAYTEYGNQFTLDRDITQTRELEQTHHLQASYAQGSLLSADAISVDAGRHLAIQGSDVVAEQDITLVAGGAVSITGATSSVHSVSEERVEKDGLMKASSGWGFTAGERVKTSTQEQTATQYSGSTVGSVAGNLTIRAGETATVEGSLLSAGRDMAIDAERIELLAGIDQTDVIDTRRFTETGLTLAFGGTYIDGATAINQYLERADDVENERLERVKQLQAAYKAYQLYKAAAALAKASAKDSAAVRVSLTAGFSQSETVTTTHSESAIGSALLAGNNLTLIARGGEGEGAVAGDILSRGSVLSAGKAMAMTAANDIQLLSAVNLSTSDRESQSISAGAGVGASLSNSEAGIGATGNASGSYGTGDQSMREHQETTVNAASFTFASGRDTTLRGAVVTAERIDGSVGGNLVLASEQDHVTFGATDMSLGGSATAGLGGGFSFSASAGDIASDYLSVIEQTGFFAGAGGFDLRVGGKTDLTGAVIASTASADRNALSTGSLVYRDIENHAEWSMEQATVGTSLSFGLADGDSDRNVTRAAVAAGTLTVRDDAATGRDSTTGLLRDTGKAHQVLGQNFDETEARETAELVQSIVDLGTTITRDQRQDAAKAAAAQRYLELSAREANGEILNEEDAAWLASSGKEWNEADAKAVVGDKSKQEIETTAKQWAVGGSYSLGMGLLTGVLGGGTIGVEQALGNAFIVASPDVNRQIGDFKANQSKDALVRMDDASKRYAEAQAQGLGSVLELMLAKSDFDEAQADLNFWNDGGLGAISLHALNGALQGLSSGNIVSGLLAEGLTEAGGSYFSNGPAWLQKAGSIGLGLVGGSVGGDVSSVLQGAGIANTSDTYNRQLHLEEMNAIRKMAKKLAALHAHDKGRPEQQRSVEYWENMLMQEALAQVDTQGLSERNAFLQSMGAASRNPLSEGAVTGQASLYISDSQVAMDAVLGMKGAVLETDPLHGTIVAFWATDAQKKNSLLYGRGGATPGFDDYQSKNYVQSQNAQLDSRLSRFHEQVSSGMSVANGSAEALYIVEELALGGVQAKVAEGAIAVTRVAVNAVKEVVEGVVEKRAIATAEEAAIKKLAIENNLYADADGFSNVVVRDFDPGITHRAEIINAGQVTDRDGLPRFEDAKEINDLISGGNGDIFRWSTQRPAWMEGTSVTDRVTDGLEIYRMVVDEKSFIDIQLAMRAGDPERAVGSLGGWATKDPINSVSDVRNRLAISSEWKGEAGSAMYVVEFSVKPGVGLREGTVGPMYDKLVNSTYPGGGHQVQFMQNAPWQSPDKFIIDLSKSRVLP
ncbi:MAG: hemagglutinin repeat-containing protein [Pseudomonadota bacterium]